MGATAIQLRPRAVFTSARAEYALRALVDLSGQPSDVLVKVAEIAARQRIPLKFLEVVLGDLRDGGFVKSQRGAGGGYLLARPAETIMVGEVLRYLNRESSQRDEMDPDPLRLMWARLDHVVDSLPITELR